MNLKQSAVWLLIIGAFAVCVLAEKNQATFLENFPERITNEKSSMISEMGQEDEVNYHNLVKRADYTGLHGQKYRTEWKKQQRRAERRQQNERRQRERQVLQDEMRQLQQQIDQEQTRLRGLQRDNLHRITDRLARRQQGRRH